MSKRENQSMENLRRALRERGSRLSPRVLRLARATFGDAGDALSHQDCIDALPEYVDAEIAGERLTEKFPQVKRHLDSCGNCSEQYAELLGLTLAERVGEIPTPAKIPEPDLAFLPPLSEPVPVISFSEFVKQKAAAILQAVAPTELPDLSGIVDSFFKRIDLLDAGSVFLGGKFAFSRRTAQAMGLGADELTRPVATLAVAYSATGKLVESLTPDNVDSLAAQNALGRRAEERALLAAQELNIKPALAEDIAREFAALVAADPQTLRALIAREKR